MSRILEAAERVFAADPSASLGVVAKEAGVARTTVHRRFSSRDELQDALVEAINERLRAATRSANTKTAPPLMALFQLTVATLELKVDWRSSWRLVDSGESGRRGIDSSVVADLDSLIVRARDTGLLDSHADILWIRKVHMALIHEAGTARTDAESASNWANLVMRTLLRGIGRPGLDLDSVLAGETHGD